MSQVVLHHLKIKRIPGFAKITSCLKKGQEGSKLDFEIEATLDMRKMQKMRPGNGFEQLGILEGLASLKDCLQRMEIKYTPDSWEIGGIHGNESEVPGYCLMI